jgi:hypothetical protein
MDLRIILYIYIYLPFTDIQVRYAACVFTTFYLPDDIYNWWPKHVREQKPALCISLKWHCYVVCEWLGLHVLWFVVTWFYTSFEVVLQHNLRLKYIHVIATISGSYSAKQEIPFRGTWRFTVVLITAFHWSPCQKIQIQPALPSRSLMSSHLCLKPLSGPLHSGVLSKFAQVFLITDMRDTKSVHPIFSDLITVMLFGTFFRVFSSFFLSTLFLNVLSLCNSAWVRKQVAARIKDHLILICAFFEVWHPRCVLLTVYNR